MNIGERVGVVLSAHDGVVKFLGYGTYEGSQIPETDDIKFAGLSLKSANISNPKLKLDNGDIVWGCECWWGPEEKIKRALETAKEIINVDIKTERQNANQDNQSSTEQKV